MKPFLTLLLGAFSIVQVMAQVPDTLKKQLDSTLDNNLNQYRDQFDEMVSKTVITADEIVARGYDNLDELLSSVEGVSISHDRTFTQIAIRGLSPSPDNNQRVMVLLDGVPLNNPMSGQAPSGYDLRGINMEDIEEVVVIRGASPVAYGNNALTGVIKIKTKKAKTGGRINFDTGSYGELDGGFAAGFNKGKFSVGLSGRFAHQKGQQLYIPIDSIPDREAFDFGGTQLQVNYGGFSLKATYLQRQEAMPGLPATPYIAVIDPITNAPSTSYFHRNQTDDAGLFKGRNIYVDLSYNGKIRDKQAIETHLFVNFQQSSEQLFFHEIETIDTTYIDPNSAYIDYQVDQQQKSLWAGLSHQHYYSFNEKHHLTAGIQFISLIDAQFGQDAALLRHYDPPVLNTTEPFFVGAQYYLDSLVRKPFQNYQKQFPYWAGAFNIQDQFRINSYIAIQAGLRVELSSIAGVQLAPMGRILISPIAGVTDISISYDQGYRLPTILESAVTQSKQSFPNPALKAEKLHNFGLNLKQKITKDLNLNLGFYHQRTAGLIVKQRDRYENFIDSLNPILTGLEAALAYKFQNGISTHLNYNFLFNKTPLVNAPAQLCKFGLLVPFLTHFYIYTEGQYEGARLLYNGNFSSAFFLLNSNIAFRPRFGEQLKWLNGLQVAFRMYNILDEFYQHPVHPDLVGSGMMPQNGRNWQVQLTFQF